MMCFSCISIPHYPSCADVRRVPTSGGDHPILPRAHPPGCAQGTAASRLSAGSSDQWMISPSFFGHLFGSDPTWAESLLCPVGSVPSQSLNDTGGICAIYGKIKRESDRIYFSEGWKHCSSFGKVYAIRFALYLSVNRTDSASGYHQRLESDDMKTTWRLSCCLHVSTLELLVVSIVVIQNS